MKFDSIIKKIYYDPGGYGSMQDTFKKLKRLTVLSNSVMLRIGLNVLLKGRRICAVLILMLAWAPVMNLRWTSLM